MAEQEHVTHTIPDDDNVRTSHNYDGIEEYDNPMPPWWVWLFVITVIWTPIYILGVHQFGFINTYEEDLAAKQAELAALRDAAAEANPVQTIDDAYIAGFFGNADHEAAGATMFGSYCAACHGNAGEGLIGPNMTDDAWLYDPSPTSQFNIITNGILDKGMTPWESLMSIEERAQVVAYLQTLRGSDPPNAKAAEGEPASAWEPEEEAESEATDA